MREMTACCGLMCNECGAFLAKQSNDDEIRKQTAKQWSEMFKADIKPDDINCDGCRAEGGVHFSHCNVCEIRKCCTDKGLSNCSVCDDYACDTLGAFFKFAPEAKENLEKIRS